MVGRKEINKRGVLDREGGTHGREGHMVGRYTW